MIAALRLNRLHEHARNWLALVAIISDVLSNTVNTLVVLLLVILRIALWRIFIARKVRHWPVECRKVQFVNGLGACAGENA